MKPNLILGVGCQKGGTTWLFSYLEEHPSVKMSPTKEMHIFETHFMPEVFGMFYRQSLSRVQRRAAEALQKRAFVPQLNMNLEHEINRLNIYHDIREYRNYFLKLAHDQNGVKVVGEISPTYSALEATHFHEIRALLEESFNIKIVFLMRDPIDRIQSQQRMIAKRNAARKVPNPPSKNLHGIEFYTNRLVEIRTRYDKTIQNLEQVFQPEDIFYGFYETLFSPEEIRRLCDFLEIDYVPADFDKRVNDAPKLEHVTDPALLQEAREYYDQTYKFCAERFSEEFIGKIWSNY